MVARPSGEQPRHGASEWAKKCVGHAHGRRRRRARRGIAPRPPSRSSAARRGCAPPPRAGRRPVPPATPRPLPRAPSRPGREPGRPPRLRAGRRAVAAGRAPASAEPAARSGVRNCSSSSSSAKRLAIQQLAQLLRAEQLAQQVAIERERLRSPIDERRVALVHVRGDVVEHQRAREGRRAPRLDAHQPDLAPLDCGQDAAQRRQVEDVLEALAVRLEDDREDAVPAGHASSCAERWRICHSGVRCPARRRGSSSARAAFSRKWLENSADPPRAPITSSSTSSEPMRTASSLRPRRRRAPGQAHRPGPRRSGPRRPARRSSAGG